MNKVLFVVVAYLALLGLSLSLGRFLGYLIALENLHVVGMTFTLVIFYYSNLGGVLIGLLVITTIESCVGLSALSRLLNQCDSTVFVDSLW